MQLSHVMTTVHRCSTSSDKYWNLPERSFGKKCNGLQSRSFHFDFQGEQRSPPGTPDTSRHCDRHKLAAAICNICHILIMRIGVFLFLCHFFLVYFPYYCFSSHINLFFIFLFFFLPFSFPSHHCLVTHSVNSTADHLLEVGDSTQSNTSYLREGSQRLWH